MSLSSEWSSSVVVRADRNGGEVVSQQAPTNSSARAYAASGNPILVRARDPTTFTAASAGGDESRESGAASFSPSRALVRALAGRDISETFWTPDAGRNEVGLLETLHRRGETNRTFVLLQSRPLPELQFNFSTCTGMNIDLSHNAFRLSKTVMALHSMDAQLDSGDDDLGDDYSKYEQFVDDRTGEVFFQAEDGKFYPLPPSSPSTGNGGGSRSRQRSGGRINVSTKGFKSVMRASLQSLQEEDYYLVKYRDYSAWAISNYRSIAKSDTVFGRKYVEQCFAVHVGREPGEFIAITEAQFLFGVEILQRQLLNQLDGVKPSTAAAASAANKSSYMQYQVDINYSALNADQFRALGALLGDGLRPVRVEYEEKKKAEEEAKARAQGFRRGDRFYEPPAWYDWTPGAIRKRVQHQLETYYVSVGRLAIQLVVIGGIAFFTYRTVKPYLPTLGGDNDNNNNNNYHRSNNNSSRGRGRGGGGGRGNDSDDSGRSRRTRKSYWFSDGPDDEEGFEYVRRGFFRSVLMGPREVLDYMLAPTDD